MLEQNTKGSLTKQEFTTNAIGQAIRPEDKDNRRKEYTTKYKGLYRLIRKKDNDIIYQGRYRGKDGKQRRVTLGRRSEGMTEESAYILRLQMIQDDRTKKPKAPTLTSVFEQYLKNKKLQNGGPIPSEERMRSSFRSNFNKIKRKEISKITNDDILEIRYQLLSQGKSIKTLYNYLGLLRTIFRFNDKKNRIKTQKINWSQYIPKTSELPDKTEVLSDNEMESLLKSLEEEAPHIKNFFLFAIITGMRKSELFNLQWSHVKWSKREILIVKPKSKRANETIVMTKGMKKVLINQKELVDNSNFPDKDSGHVFYTPKGFFWKPKSRSIQIISERLRGKIGVDDFRMVHGLRHHFGATHAIAGTGSFTIKELMRHSSVKMSERYIKIVAPEQRKAAENVEKKMFEKYKIGPS